MAKAQEAYFDFMEEYTEFLERMLKDESEKLSALQSRELARIEHSIAISQANAKQLENYEQKRISLQGRAGMDGMSFRQVIEQAPQAEQNWLWQLFSRFERSVGEIRFHNDKSMAVARDHMVELDPSAVAPAGAPSETVNPYKKMRDEQNDQTNILETKV